MALFKEHLSYFMAQKQAYLKHYTPNKLPDESAVMKTTFKLADDNQALIETHGLALLEWTTPSKLQKQYPSLDTEEFYLAQALSLNPQAQLIEEIFNSEEFDIEEILKESGQPLDLENTPKKQTKNNNVIDFPTNNQTPAELKTLQLKIQLKGSKPPIWRRIETPNNLNLYQLHLIIQDLFGLLDYHLHEFSQGHDIIDEDLEQQITLQQILEPIDELDYAYDFGDGWEFTITLEQTKEYQASKFKDTKAICITGKRGAIIEDIGGIPVLNELARNLKNGQSIPEHLSEFFNEHELKFTLEEFNKTQLNTDLKKLTQAW
ncbi:plasmid pRiA4b ORF-3 family protein [Thiomicrorhabdus sp. Kp2]|uniref:plasmid pRiA4b ORF-3 family protein n=1 Tax=Thiomicrorhabdus sp. Kp2 TaxID=1123518 RepID=UPI000685EEEB|nr:plasmid pRiA4b ORF-3 family protein [Thiomicrorhabdus sp. Kp2]